MNVENTKEMRDIQKVAATMAVEGMPLSEDFVKELIKVSKGEETSEQLKQEVIKEFVR